MTDHPDSVEPPTITYRDVDASKPWPEWKPCRCATDCAKIQAELAAERELCDDLHDKLHAERRAHDAERERYAKLEAENAALRAAVGEVAKEIREEGVNIPFMQDWADRLSPKL